MTTPVFPPVMRVPKSLALWIIYGSDESRNLKNGREKVSGTSSSGKWEILDGRKVMQKSCKAGEAGALFSSAGFIKVPGQCVNSPFLLFEYAAK